jgi:hypothetical protein
MPRLFRFLLAAAAIGGGVAHAQQQVLQTPAGVSPALEVERLAPQLVAFAGGDVNFENLVNGLAFGLPVTLRTPLATGATQLVSFTPSATLTALQIAQTLESARQLAIGNGIAVPTAEQLAAILNGGTLTTAAGASSMNGLIGTGAAATSLVQPNVSAAQRPSPAAILQSVPHFQTSHDPTPGNLSDSPLLPGATQGLASPGPNATPSPFTGAVTAPSALPGGSSAGGPAAARLGVAR